MNEHIYQTSGYKKIFNFDGTNIITPPDVITLLEPTETTQEGGCECEKVSYVKKEFVEEIVEYMQKPHQACEDTEMYKKLRQSGFDNEFIANICGRQFEDTYLL